MAITKVKSSNIEDSLDLSGKTVTLPAASVTAHASPAPTLDSPVITGTLSVVDSGAVTHTVANYSADCSYTITPTNCTVGAVNASGQFVITHTSGTPSYTIKATTASLGLGDSTVVTKNLTMQLSAPTLSSPADVGTAVDVVYTITSTTADDDKIILDPGTANFTYQSVSVGTASKVGNTVECIGFTTNNPAVTIQFTAEATYSVTAKSANIAGTYGTSANSSADSITIAPQIPTGGIITTDGDYKVHTFLTSPANFDIPSLTAVLNSQIEYLVVAGGGGGGSSQGAGGGAGGYRTNYGGTAMPVTAVTYAITVGAGGAGGVTISTGSDGGNSSIVHASITDIISTGGGGGGKDNTVGRPGGSGGGGGWAKAGGAGNVGGNGGSPSIPEGYAGGTGVSGSTWPTGGGGGSSAVGQTPANGSAADGVGGAGTANSITGSSVTYAAGGGSCAGTAGTGSAAGHSSAGAGKNSSPGNNGLANRGGGGGGVSPSASGTVAGAGGSGVVIIRYKFQ